MISVNKKVIIYFVLFISLIFIFSVAVVLFIKSNSNKNKVNEEDVTMQATTLTINIKDLLSVSDDFGKTIKNDNGGSFGFAEIEVVNETDEEKNYEIYVTDSTVSKNKINPNYIKLYLTDENNNPIGIFDSSSAPNYVNLSYLSDKPSSKLLLKGTIGPKGSTNLRLRSWISDSFITDSGKNSFSYDLGIRAVN